MIRGGSLRGVLVDAPVVSLEAKYPDTILDYTVDIPDAIDREQDFIASVTAAASPSGDGELVLSGLSVADLGLTLTTSAGQPGRVYTIKFIVAMLNGRVFPFVVSQLVSPVLPTDQPQAVPSFEFGATIIWNFAQSLDFSDPRNSGYLAGF
jgi:hypothetical protein